MFLLQFYCNFSIVNNFLRVSTYISLINLVIVYFSMKYYIILTLYYTYNPFFTFIKYVILFREICHSIFVRTLFFTITRVNRWYLCSRISSRIFKSTLHSCRLEYEHVQVAILITTVNLKVLIYFHRWWRLHNFQWIYEVYIL